MPYQLNISDIKRFFSKIKKTKTCWIWNAGLTKDGYGQFWLRGSNRRAHRIAWEMENNSIPAGLLVLHKCDNPSCVNPNHLFLGNSFDNMQDRDRKNRQAFGERQGSSKLTQIKVSQIRQLYRNELSQTQLAKKFDTVQSNISYIISNTTWSNG